MREDQAAMLGHVVTVGAEGPLAGLPCWVGPPANRYAVRFMDPSDPDVFLWPIAPRPEAQELGIPPLLPFVWTDLHVESTGLGTYRSRLEALAMHPLARPPRCVVIPDERRGGWVFAPPYDPERGHHVHRFIRDARRVESLVMWHAGLINREEYLTRAWASR